MSEVWNLNEGVEFIRNLELVLDKIGYHSGLTGSVLYKGFSEKDLDVMVYPHKTTNEKTVEEVLTVLEVASIKVVEQRDHTGFTNCADSKTVYHCEWKGKRIDFFFVK